MKMKLIAAAKEILVSVVGFMGIMMLLAATLLVPLVFLVYAAYVVWQEVCENLKQDRLDYLKRTKKEMPK